jgi:Lon protease-like protein
MEIPLFPLHTVLFPGVALPLHIFEERYRVMVARCLEADAPFGIVLIRDGRDVGGGDLSIAGVGTFAAIREAERLADGRYDLLTVGVGRFAIRSVDTDREPYLVATVEPLAERMEDPAEARRMMQRVTRRFVDYLHLVKPQEGEEGADIDVRLEIEIAEDPDDAAVADDDATGAGDAGPAVDAEGELERGIVRRIRVPDDPGTLAHLLSGIIQVDQVQKQALLESDTVEERLTGLEAILAQEVMLLERRLRRFAPDPRLASIRRN